MTALHQAVGERREPVRLGEHLDPSPAIRGFGVPQPTDALGVVTEGRAELEGVGDVVERRRGPGVVEVDERHRIPVAPHHVPGSAVAVAHELAGSRCSGRARPVSRPAAGGTSAPRRDTDAGDVRTRAGRRRARHTPSCARRSRRGRTRGSRDPRGRSRARVALRRSPPPRDTGAVRARQASTVRRDGAPCRRCA